MKKTILSAAILACTTLCAINNASATTCTASETTTIKSAGYTGGYTYLGVLTTVYVDATKQQFTVTIPKPQERITGCAPGNFQLMDMGSYYQVTGRLMDIDLYNQPSGTSSYFEVGGTQSNGETIVYKVIVVAK